MGFNQSYETWHSQCLFTHYRALRNSPPAAEECTGIEDGMRRRPLGERRNLYWHLSIVDRALYSPFLYVEGKSGARSGQRA
jgi:hypothetical protein